MPILADTFFAHPFRNRFGTVLHEPLFCDEHVTECILIQCLAHSCHAGPSSGTDVSTHLLSIPEKSYTRQKFTACLHLHCDLRKQTGPIMKVDRRLGGSGSGQDRAIPTGRSFRLVRACGAQCYSCRIRVRMGGLAPSLFPFGLGTISLFP